MLRKGNSKTYINNFKTTSEAFQALFFDETIKNKLRDEIIDEDDSINIDKFV